MKTFSDRWRQLEWDDIRLRINSKTAADVERALAAKQLTRDDMMALPLACRGQLPGTAGPARAAPHPAALRQYRQLLRAAVSLQPVR
ncbi:Thiazole biosynthesis protein ThiH [Klebsiella pneumoniae]|nr:Thiazole biosynthesis protein ThiH [Klebsiella pneumoniae]